MMKSRDDRVGRGNPPKASRIKPGTTLNPKGRPRGALNTATIVRRVAEEKHLVSADGKRSWRTTTDIVVDRLLAKALGGDIAAIKLRDNIMDQTHTGETVRAVLLVSERPDIDIWEREALITLAFHETKASVPPAAPQMSGWAALRARMARDRSIP